MKSFILAIFILPSLFTSVRAQTIETLHSHSPYFYVPEAGGSLDQLPLKSTDVEVEIAGVIADVFISQKYVNKGKKPLEAVYVFPAATRAAVYGMQMQIGNRLLVAKIAEKEKARKHYEKAKREGKSASLLEQDRPNVFRMNVANIMPGDTVITLLKYTELLIPEKSTYQFVFPTVVGPRYAGEESKIAKQASYKPEKKQEHFNHNPCFEETMLGDATFSLSVHLKAPVPILKVKSKSHRITWQEKNNKNYLIELDESYGVNKDFILEYQLKNNQIETGIMISEHENENFFLAMVQPPAVVEASKYLPREYTFIVDVSGSMRGFPMETSKKMIKKILSGFRNEDKFNLVLFASGITIYANNSLPATEENISKAFNFLDNFNGGGGTNLLQALDLALQLPQDKNRSHSFILLSDGYVTVEKEAFNRVRNNLNQANFFSVGVGSSVNRFIMEGLAYAGQGQPVFLTHPDHLEQQLGLFKSYLDAPVLTNASYRFEDFEAIEVQPSVLPDLLAQRPLIFFGKYKGKLKGNLQIKGKTADGDYTLSVPLKKAAKVDGEALKNLWARDAIRRFSDYEYLDETEKQLVVDFSIDYNLLTEFTSFYAIDTVISNLNQIELTKVRQALPLPDGVTNNAVPHSPDRVEIDFDFDVEDEVVFETSYYEKELINEVFTVVESQPEFPGGYDSLYRFMQAHLKYPGNYSIEGKVFVQFVVDVDGSVTEAKIVKGLHPGFDVEALRVIKMLPRWKPGKQRGRPVKVRMVLPVHFIP